MALLASGIPTIPSSAGDPVMTGIQITIELDSADLDAALDRAIAGGEDLRQPMGKIAEEWLGHVRKRFAEERDPLGVPWKKRRVEPGEEDAPHKLLQLTGALEGGIAPEFGSDFAQLGVLPSGGPGKYARIHNEGGTIRPKEKKALSFGGRIVSQVVMPKRQFLGFGQAEQTTVEEVMGDFLRGLFAVPA